MQWGKATIASDIAHLTTDLARLEVKLDASISQTAADRSITQAHIAECNLRNKRADEEETNAKREWEAFKGNVFSEIKDLSSKVGKTQFRLGLVISTALGIAWAVDHFHAIFPPH